MSDHGSFQAIIQLDMLKTITLDNSSIYSCVYDEDLYSFGAVGKLSIYDKYGIKEYGPITGDEKLIILTGKTSPIAREFNIIKIARISGVKEFQQAKTSVIDLYFVEPYFKNLIMKKYSKAWPIGKKASDIVNDIVVKMLEITSDVDIEPSETLLDNFCMPYWTPAETIRWITARAKGTRGKCNYGYLFYSNVKKRINFKTLDNLLNNAEIDSVDYELEPTTLNKENLILSWQILGADQMGIREVGGGQLLGYDSSEKKFIGFMQDEQFIYSTAVKQITSLGNSSLFDGFTIDNKCDIFNYTYETTGESNKDIIKNLFYNNFIRRYSLQNAVKLLVTGHNKRYIGQKITIKWPSTFSTKEVFSTVDSGQYLVKSIKHSFSPLTTPFYTQSLICIKNAYQNPRVAMGTPVSGITMGSNFTFGLFS